MRKKLKEIVDPSYNKFNKLENKNKYILADESVERKLTMKTFLKNTELLDLTKKSNITTSIITSNIKKGLDFNDLLRERNKKIQSSKNKILINDLWSEKYYKSILRKTGLKPKINLQELKNKYETIEKKLKNGNTNYKDLLKIYINQKSFEENKIKKKNVSPEKNKKILFLEKEISQIKRQEFSYNKNSKIKNDNYYFNNNLSYFQKSNEIMKNCSINILDPIKKDKKYSNINDYSDKSINKSNDFLFRISINKYVKKVLNNQLKFVSKKEKEDEITKHIRISNYIGYESSSDEDKEN